MPRCMGRGDLIENVAVRLQGEEAVGDAFGNEQGALVDRRQFGPDPLAVGGTVGPQVDRDIEDAAAHRADQFGFSVGRLLEMQPTQGAPGRIGRKAGLHGFERNARGGERLRAVQSRKAAPVIAIRLGLDDHHADDIGGQEPHQSSTRVAGEAITKRPPQSAMKSSWRVISSLRFHGRMST